jgi:dolichyl-diphosphooligosaccharide--protein glycosyltransferase
VRYQQFDTWKKNPTTYFVGERPLMTTLDAPHWLRMAREYNEGIFGQKEALRRYPESTDIYKEIYLKKISVPLKYSDPTLASSFSSLSSSSLNPGIRYLDVPLLSFLIAHIAPFFNYNYYLTGTLMIPTLASIFILPLGIFFFRIGIPASGLLGGLIGTFASGYYMRSSIGRIDTDMLNLFFPLLVSLLILLSSQAKTERSVLLYSAGSGLSLFLFLWWYNRPGFTLIYFVVLVFILFIQQIRFRTILLSSFLFVLCAHPEALINSTVSVQQFLQGYLGIEDVVTISQIKNEMAPAIFPNAMTTISEVNNVRMEEVLRRILFNPLFDWAGLIALFGLAVLRWRVLLPMLPLLVLGLLSFKSSNRFIMYLAPFVGIGLGWMLQLGIETIFLLITKNFHRRGLMTKKERRKSKGSRRSSPYSLKQGKHFESTMMDIDGKGERGKFSSQ